MKSFVTLLTSFFLIFALTGEAHAKRLGGGGFGKSHKTTPFQQKKQEPKQGQQQNPQQPASQQKGKGLMGGMLGGLLAGGLFAYLLGSGAFEGIQLMDILLMAALFFIIMRVLRSMAGNQARSAYQGSGAAPLAGQESRGYQAFDASQSSHQGGSFQSDEAPMNLPDGFDADGFTEGALQHYRTLQQAWNDGDLGVVEEYVSAPLFAGLKQQRERLMVPPQTEILDLSASIVRADQQGNIAEISVLFRGLCKDDLEKSEDGIFDVWHLERDTSIEGSSWLIVGIEAE